MKKCWSVLTDDMSSCYITHLGVVHIHHVFNGSRKAASEERGFLVPLRVLLHPLWGRLAAFLVIPAGCVLGAALGMMTGGLVLFAVLAWAPDLKAAYPGPLGSLAADALLPAFGWVVALLSMISALYAIFSFLEDTGYLARVAYLMDSFLSGLGIDGKSAIPLMMGFLCNTVSIAGSRVVDSPRRRLITLCMLPFIPCSGQMGRRPSDVRLPESVEVAVFICSYWFFAICEGKGCGWYFTNSLI